MPAQPHDTGQGRPTRRVSMVPLRSSYSRAPYASQKNTLRSTAGASSLTGAIEPTHLPQPQVSQASGSSTQTRNGRGANRSRTPQRQPQQQVPETHVDVFPTLDLSELSYSSAASTQPVISAPHPAPARPTPPPARPASAPTRTRTQRKTADTTRNRAKDAGQAQPARKAKNVAAIVITIFLFFTYMAPKIVDAIMPDRPWDVDDVVAIGGQDEDFESATTIFAEPPVPIPMKNILVDVKKLPPQESGSRETPAQIGERISINDVAFTVENVQRGSEADRAAWDMAPPGYEYVLVDIRLENPSKRVIDFDPVIINDDDEAIHGEISRGNDDFRYEAKPDANGTREGQMLFLVERGVLGTLMFYSYDYDYPVVFYALP